MKMQAVSLALFAGALTAAGVQATAKDEQALQVHVIADDFEFEPNVLKLPAAIEVELTMENISTSMDHNLTIELPGGEVAFDENVEPGESATMTFTTPDVDGEFVFFCPFEDHREQGMEGRIVVARILPPSVSRASPTHE
jgi:plastocyanin